jgi:hypothetical protein
MRTPMNPIALALPIATTNRQSPKVDDDRKTLPLPESPCKSAGIVVIFTELHAAIADKARIEIPPAQPVLLPLVAQLGSGPHQYLGDPRAKSAAYERLEANGSG